MSEPIPVYITTSLGAPRNHHALFIPLSPSTATGTLLQVTGNIQNGMTFETKENITGDPTFMFKTQIGLISKVTMPRVRDAVQAIPAPGKQFDGPKGFHLNVPIRRCQEWTQEVIAALRGEGLLKN